MAHELDTMFKPKSIAVIGASRRKDSLGYTVLHNLVEHDFNGSIFPINPKAEVIHSFKCYKSVLAIVDDIDLAIIVVPRHEVLKVVEECGIKGIKGLVVITAGFKETGAEGEQLEEELMQRVEKYGMRMLGPNCMGLINTDQNVSIDATFGKAGPLRGKIGFISQSGALGVIILEYARQLRVGLSMFASVGNKRDISSNDLLQYWEKDSNTELILLYLESFGNPRKFTQIARQVSRSKPIIAVKAGRTSAGARAASSHTGALAGLDVAVDALFEQCGVLRVTSIEELFDVGKAFSNQPAPRGERVGILTNAGGPAILITDALVSLGLQIANLEKKTKEYLREHLPREASVENPIDMIASAAHTQYNLSLKALLEDENIDAVVVIFVTPIMIDPMEIAKAIISASQGSKKTLLACFMGSPEAQEAIEKLENHCIPVYKFPESAAKSLALMVKYNRWKEKPRGNIKQFEVDKKSASQIIEKALKEQRDKLFDYEVREVLQTYGIPLIASEPAKNLDEAVKAAHKMGYPIVLKINSPDVVHKTDVGGVMLDIRSEQELGKAYNKLMSRLEKIKPKPQVEGVIVQQMITHGKETIIGVSMDPNFGPLIMFGLGGIYVEIMKDVSFRIHPITDQDAVEMIQSIRGYPLLQGVRGEKPVDQQVLVDVLLRVSQLISDFHQIKELDINPLIVCHKGEQSRVVDARISINGEEK
jgi:acetyl coenzyme A synthetase (ADP forming)-like protein